ncbi:MAG: hypothetical protein GX591_04965 [Planctomycetes bacterium]|nr:hypothetical protein [Planctomycetota bacterium]
MAYNAACTGSPFRTGYEGDHGQAVYPYSGAPGFSTPLLVGLYGNLFSTGRSIFLYSPAVLVAVGCFGVLWRRNRTFAALGLAPGVYLLAVWSKWWAWHGGMVWGNRTLLPALVLLMPAIAAGWEERTGRRWARWAAVAILALGFLIQLPALAVSVGDFYASVEGFDSWTFENEYRVHFVPHACPLAGHLRIWRDRNWRPEDLYLWRHAADLPGAAIATAALVALLGVGLVLGGSAAAGRWGSRVRQPATGSDGGSGQTPRPVPTRAD